MTVFEGSRIRAARKAAHLTQQELAAKADTSRETINRAENSQNIPHPETLARIARVLGVALDGFFGDAA